MADGFLMPQEDDPFIGADMHTGFDSVTRDQQISSTRQQYGGNYGAGSVAAGTIGLAPLDLLDTAAASLGLTTRGAITEGALSHLGNAVGWPGLMNFYNENKGAIEVGSGIAAVIASDYGAGKVLAPAGAAMRALSVTRLGAKVASLDAEYQRALAAVSVVDRMAARRGAMSVEQFTSPVTLTSLGVEAPAISRAAVGQGAIFANIKRGLVRNATTEAILSGVANQNSFLYGPDMSENLLWMGAGLGFGAVVDRMATVYAMRKYVNRDVVTRKFVAAYDPTGVEGDRLHAMLSDVDPSKDLSVLGYAQGHYSDQATSFMVQARSLANRALTNLKDLAGRRERFGTQQITLAMDSMQKITTRGVAGVPRTAFSMDAEELGNHVRMRLNEDPSSFYGTEMLGAASKDRTLTQIHEDRTANLAARYDYVHRTLSEGGVWRTRNVWEGEGAKRAKVKKQVLVPLTDDQLEPYRAEMKQLEFHRALTPMVSLGKEWSPLSIGKLLDNFEEPKIIREVSDERKLWRVSDPDSKLKLGFSNDGETFLPAGKTIDNLDFYDHMRLYRTAQQATDDMISNRTVFALPAKPNWFQLDAAEHIIQKTGDESLVIWPGGMTRQTAQVESLKQKIATLGGLKKLDDPDAMARARMQYNLPALSAYESGLLGTSEHPLDVILRSANTKQIDQLTYGDLMKGIRDVRNINGLAKDAKDKLESLSGDMFSFMRDGQGKPIQPILGYKRPFNPFDWSREDLAEKLAMRKAYEREQLMGGDDFTKVLTGTIVNDPDFYTASQVQGLMDVQLQSFLPGFTNAAPATTRGEILSAVTSREWRDRDNPVLLGAGRIRDKAERLIRSVMKEKIQSFLGDVHNRVNGPRNNQTRLLLNNYLSYRPGWDLLEEPTRITLPSGQNGWMFSLDPKSEMNAKRWQSQFNERMPEDAVLRTPQGRDIVLDDLGLEFKNKFNNATDDIVNSKNTILKATGLGRINRQTHYAPPPNIKGKYIGFTLDIERRPVPGGTVIAATPEEFTRLKGALERDPASVLNRDGHVFYTQDELKDFADVWDRAQMDFIDPGTTAVQPGKRGTGRLSGPALNPNAIEDSLTWLRDSYLSHGDNVMKLLTKDAVNSAETRAQVARVTRKNVKGDASQGRSIYDHYIDNLTGRLGITSPGSQVGRFYRGSEAWANRILAETTPGVSSAWRGFHDYIANVIPGAGSKTQDAVYNKLVSDLGPYMPFNSAAEMAERLHGATRPPELAKITGNMSQFEAAMRLRMLEIIHPVMNLSGMINAIPSVLNHIQRMAGETAEEHAARVGHSASIFDMGNDKQISMIDMGKIAYRAFKRTWSRASHPDFDYMMGHGFITQEVAEFHRQFGAINSRGSWSKFFNGDQSITNPQNIREALAQKGMVGHLSTLSDRSEDFSRSWGHMVGLEVADAFGVEGRGAQHNFAHDIANKMIADYNPKNRPEIFQGALGAPIGLFQSFIWNYYQRLFRYIETGDRRSFALQYALQAGLYGSTTLPGWSVVNKLFFDHSNGENSPYDAIYQRFGQSAGDFLMGGVLSNLPKMINILPGHQGVPGLDLYSRGDTNIRVPIAGQSIPIFDSMKRIYHAIGQGVAAFSGRNPNLTVNQLADIASNMMTNRPIAGFIEQAFAGGYDTDAYGQVAARSHDAMESTYRVMGVRSLRQSKELQAFYGNKNAQELQNAKMDDLRLSVRSAIRAGEMDSIPNYFNQYVLTGGDPRRFKQWVKENYKAATTTRAERMLDHLMKNHGKWSMTQRLLDAQVQPEDQRDDNPYQVTPADIPEGNADMPDGFLDPSQIDNHMNQIQSGAPEGNIF